MLLFLFLSVLAIWGIADNLGILEFQVTQRIKGVLEEGIEIQDRSAFRKCNRQEYHLMSGCRQTQPEE